MIHSLHKVFSFSCLVAVFLLISCTGNVKSTETSKEEKLEKGFVSLVINYGAAGSKTYDSLAWSKEQSIYEVLHSDQAVAAGVAVIDTLYAGMGHLVIGFDSVRNESPDYWTYCVNGKKANKGIDEFEISAGDEISWHFGHQENICE